MGAGHVASAHIAAVGYTAGGTRLAVAERGGRLYSIDAETLEPEDPVADLQRSVPGMYASPDNHTVIVVDDNRFEIVDLDTGATIRSGDVGVSQPFGAFSPDGRRFAASGGDGQVQVLDVATGSWKGPPRKVHEGRVEPAAFSPDGATFVTGGSDGVIVLSDGQTGAEVNRVPSGRPGKVEPSFLPDGHTVLMPSFDGTVSTWNTDPNSWTEFACAIAGRNFTQDEWRDAFGARPYHETCPATR
jgi:WD40 repeat protein